MEKEKVIEKLESMIRMVIPNGPHKSWEYYIDIENTGFHIDYLKFQAIFIEGTTPGSCSGNNQYKCKVSINYNIGNSSKDYERHYDFEDLKEAAKFVLEFVDIHKVCMDCGRLIRKEQTCRDCEFFGVFHEYRGITNNVCSICQETVLRRMLPCGHYFHHVCILQLDNKNIKCPNCRTPIPKYVCDVLFREEDDLDSDDEY